ncbi:hypothetical protein D9758_000881 [Tetrapyrgos nigripes]|uniref:DUF300-domain-containing protein n=1 Tax=Tetrapyrgos nigripes TaxID=182062 RepID=A0A8H5GZN5_9AGAR|nr:hypothetical protein D9758_000881 [Tetrapyrgos nigripes]
MSNSSEPEPTSSARCFKVDAADGPSLFQNGNLVFQAHHVGWIVASSFTLVAIIASFWLINKHLIWYTDKREQRYIVRILFMVPIYAVVSLASYFFWNHATPLLLIRDGYESTVLTSFFYLLLNYLSHDPDEQRAIFLKEGISKEAEQIALKKGEQPRKWMFPLGFIKSKPTDGLYFLQMMKWGVLQYCVIRPTTTLAAVILDYAGLYCEESWGPGWGHVYITVIVSISVTIGMYCLIQLYLSVSSYLAPTKPLLKLFAIKAVVFLTFWQATFLSVLTMFGVVKDTKYMTAADINIGIGALLETFEMMLFAFLHIRAFTYRVYKPPKGKDGLPPLHTNRWRSLVHAMNFRETFQELWIGCIYLWEKMKRREPMVDKDVRRLAHYESAFEKPRASILPGSAGKVLEKDNNHSYSKGKGMGQGMGIDSRNRNMINEKDWEDDERMGMLPDIQVEKEEYVDIGGSRQWLGYGKNYGYGIQKEPSEGLEYQIERELERRGYGNNIPGRGHIKPLPPDDGIGYGHQQQRSWWRSLYERVSQSGDNDLENRLTRSPTKRVSRIASRSRSKSKHRPHRSPSRHHHNSSRDLEADRAFLFDYQYEDPPPPSLMKKNRPSQQMPELYYNKNNASASRYTGLPERSSPRTAYPLPLSAYPEHHSSAYRSRQTPPPSPQQQQYQQQSRNGSPSRPNALSHPPSRGLSRERVFPSSGPSTPPPPSLLPPNFARSNDSLLGRVFPTSIVSHTDLVSDSTHNPLNDFGRYGPLGIAPLGIPTTPSTEHDIGMVSERRASPNAAASGSGGTPTSLDGLTAQIVNLSDTALNIPHKSRQLHESDMIITTRHDYINHDNVNDNDPISNSFPIPPQSIPVPKFTPSSPSSSSSYALFPSSPSSSIPSPHSSPRSPRPSSGPNPNPNTTSRPTGLRRSSALHSPTRQSQSQNPNRRHSAAPQLQPQPQLQLTQMPQHAYMPHPRDRRRSVPGKLTMPAPLAPPPQAAGNGVGAGRSGVNGVSDGRPLGRGRQ